MVRFRVPTATLTIALALPSTLVPEQRSAWAGGGVVDPAIEDRLVVRPAPGHVVADIVTALESAGLVDVMPLESIPGRDIWLLRHTPQPGVGLPQLEAMLLSIESDGLAQWAEVNYESQTAEGKTDSLWVTSLGSSDGFLDQYAVQVLDLSFAHLRSRGEGVIIAVLDTGADSSHPALQGSFAAGWSFLGESASTMDAGNGIDDDGDGIVDEGVGHGTFVTSLIRLVAPNSTIMSLQVLDSEGRADNYRVAKAMFHAIDSGVHIMNMSLGTTYRSAAMEQAANEASEAGIILLGAMGNQGVDEPREYPACDGGAFGIAATDSFDVVAPFSNYGPKTDFCAPGVTALAGGSAVPGQSIIGAIPGGGYATWQGTSFATALASGVAALVRAQYPDWPDATVPADAVADAVMALIAKSAVDIMPWNPAYRDGLGAGRIDAAAAVLLGPPVAVPGDLDGDGAVNGSDVGALLGQWGPCGGCVADLDLDGVVDGGDLGGLLGLWSG